VFDNPDLVAICVAGDGEAETDPAATSWHSNKFINPARDGAVLPILHLNGCKIASTDQGQAPDVVMACAGDVLERVPRLKYVAAEGKQILRAITMVKTCLKHTTGSGHINIWRCYVLHSYRLGW
jgi:phosphoketolase